MTDWVVHLIDAGGYWGIAFLMFLENVFPPIPSELIMGVGGIRAGQGRMEIFPLMLAGTIGSTLGNYAWYLAGRTLGFARLKPLIDRHGRWATIEWSHVEAIDNIFLAHGAKIIFFFRFMPAGRTLVSLPAGLFHMGHVRFLAWTFAGAAIWNAILVAVGYWLGWRFQSIDRFVGPITTAVLVLVVVAYLYRLATWKPRN